MVYLFDAANTIIHKPQIFENTQNVLKQYGYEIGLDVLKRQHKIVSEIIIFPDRTNKEFYHHFNSEWLYALGIVPSEDILDEIYKACTYLPWIKFEDTSILNELMGEKAILSNFHGGLTNILNEHFPNIFKELVISEQERHRKPQVEFYQRAVNLLGVSPEEIIYVGDSVKLDIEPALKVGMRAFLIDRNNDYPYSKHRISSLVDLKNII